MIAARHTPLGKAVADFYSGPLMRKAFKEIRFRGDAADAGLPVLAVANHFSWWDGFIQYRLNRERYGRTLYVMMLEEQLRRHMILNRCGCFSVKKGTRDVLSSLDYCAGLMHDPRNMLLIFPQGRLETLYTTDFRFEKGLDYLLGRLDGRVQLLFNVNLVDYFSDRKPSLTICCESCVPGGEVRSAQVETAFNAFAARCRAMQNICCG